MFVCLRVETTREKDHIEADTLRKMFDGAPLASSPLLFAQNGGSLRPLMERYRFFF